MFIVGELGLRVGALLARVVWGRGGVPHCDSAFVNVSPVEI